MWIAIVMAVPACSNAAITAVEATPATVGVVPTTIPLQVAPVQTPTQPAGSTEPAGSAPTPTSLALVATAAPSPSPEPSSPAAPTPDPPPATATSATATPAAAVAIAPAPEGSQAVLVANGAEVYTLNCARCHAENGFGTERYGGLIGVGSMYTPAAMIAELTDGHPVTFGFRDRISSDEIASVVAYVKATFP